MTDEEKSYFYFKVHDLDGNDKLDGLEIFYSATHHSESDNNDDHHHHDHEEQTDSNLAIDNNEISNTNENRDSETDQQPSDSTLNSSVSNPKLLEIKGNDETDNKKINHIIGTCLVNAYASLLVSSAGHFTAGTVDPSEK